jgi:3'-5' exonuclease
LIRGILDADAHAREVEVFRAFVAAQDAPHWKEFSAAWR